VWEPYGRTSERSWRVSLYFPSFRGVLDRLDRGGFKGRELRGQPEDAEPVAGAQERLLDEVRFPLQSGRDDATS
jgi:hypothetical protein